MARSLRTGARRAALVAALVLGGPPLLGFAAIAQEPDSLDLEILRSQRRLEQIREERARLRREMDDVRNQVQDVSRELRNIERQLSTSRSVLAELDFQIEGTSARVEETSGDLSRTRIDLRESSEALHRRLRNVYKLGPMHSVRVLLGAQSITDLVNRYRYLQMITAYDRSLISRVQTLERSLAAQDRELRASLGDLERLRLTKQVEVDDLRRIEDEHRRALEAFRAREREAVSRIEQLDADEARLTGLVEELDARRLERATARPEDAARTADAGPEPAGASAGALGPADEGLLEWPVDGNVIYRFGRERRPDGTVLRWNGLGIAAAPGTPVRAVRSGTVEMAGPFEGYGPTVVVSHGDGFYTLYLYLEELGVVEGREVERGQVVGTVGGRDTPEGPHLEVQIRGPVNGSTPQAMDPLRWLRPAGGAG